jgi:hypothetical protein
MLQNVIGCWKTVQQKGRSKNERAEKNPANSNFSPRTHAGDSLRLITADQEPLQSTQGGSSFISVQLTSKTDIPVRHGQARRPAPPINPCEMNHETEVLDHADAVSSTAPRSLTGFARFSRNTGFEAHHLLNCMPFEPSTRCKQSAGAREFIVTAAS